MPHVAARASACQLALVRIVALGALGTRATAGETKPQGASFVAIPSGIADPSTGSIYVTGASEKLTALDLATGGERWESDAAGRAIAIAGDRVIATTSQQKLPPNAMELVVLDAEKGHLQSTLKQIVLPEWVAVGGGIGLSFESAATVEGDTLTITWHAARDLAVAQGKVSPEMLAAAKKSTTGTVTVDLTSGEHRVSVDDTPRRDGLPRSLPFYDVAGKRLTVSQRSEKVDGGVQLIHRTLELRDQQTGRPLWRQPIVGEVYLSVVPPAATPKQPAGRRPSATRPNATRPSATRPSATRPSVPRR